MRWPLSPHALTKCDCLTRHYHRSAHGLRFFQQGHRRHAHQALHSVYRLRTIRTARELKRKIESHHRWTACGSITLSSRKPGNQNPGTIQVGSFSCALKRRYIQGTHPAWPLYSSGVRFSHKVILTNKTTSPLRSLSFTMVAVLRKMSCRAENRRKHGIHPFNRLIPNQLYLLSAVLAHNLSREFQMSLPTKKETRPSNESSSGPSSTSVRSEEISSTAPEGSLSQWCAHPYRQRWSKIAQFYLDYRIFDKSCLTPPKLHHIFMQRWGKECYIFKTDFSI